MRCTSCDFHVMWFDNYSWSDSCDYYFLRNNVPDFGRLKRKLNISQGIVCDDDYMHGVLYRLYMDMYIHVTIMYIYVCGLYIMYVYIFVMCYHSGMEVTLNV